MRDLSLTISDGEFVVLLGPTGAGKTTTLRLVAGLEYPDQAAALLAEQLAEEAEFFSIGTNDLTQYVLAAERGNSELSPLQDALHPAVLRLIKAVVEGAKTRGRHVAICGDAASDPLAASIFVGLGVHSLSLRPNQVAEVKALFRRIQSSVAEKLASAALAAPVRELARELLEPRDGRANVSAMPEARVVS